MNHQQRLKELVSALAAKRIRSEGLEQEVRNLKEQIAKTPEGLLLQEKQTDLNYSRSVEAGFRSEIEVLAMEVDTEFPGVKPHPALTVTHGKPVLTITDPSIYNRLHVIAWAVMYAPKALRWDEEDIAAAVKEHTQEGNIDAVRLFNALPGVDIVPKRGLRIAGNLFEYITVPDAVEDVVPATTEETEIPF